MPRLRSDILQFHRDDGGLDLVDMILDRFHQFDAEEAAAIAAGGTEIWARLEELLVVDDDTGRLLQEQQWSSRANGVPSLNATAMVDEVDWSRASRFPDSISPFWREGERWRRLAEERAAGRALTIARGFLTSSAALALRDEVTALEFARWTLDLLHAERHLVEEDELLPWRALFHNEDVRHVLGGVLGTSITPATTINAWRVLPGDYFRAHVDGRNYQASFSIGLCEDWRAEDGGAIAFGTPTPEGLAVSERWLPHAGDLCLFLPREARWHAVEPVVSRTRLTLSGWWMT